MAGIATSPMKTLEPPDSFHLKAAEGWLGLGDLASASDELEMINPVWKMHPSVLLVRCDIYRAAKKWEVLVTVANTLVQRLPMERHGWIHRSCGLYALGRTQAALNYLRPAYVKFPKSWQVSYNLACYCAQLGRIKEAEKWFKRAIGLNKKEVQQISIDDPNLAPMWRGIS